MIYLNEFLKIPRDIEDISKMSLKVALKKIKYDKDWVKKIKPSEKYTETKSINQKPIWYNKTGIFNEEIIPDNISFKKFFNLGYQFDEPNLIELKLKISNLIFPDKSANDIHDFLSNNEFSIKGLLDKSARYGALIVRINFKYYKILSNKKIDTTIIKNSLGHIFIFKGCISIIRINGQYVRKYSSKEYKIPKGNEADLILKQEDKINLFLNLLTDYQLSQLDSFHIIHLKINESFFINNFH